VHLEGGKPKGGRKIKKLPGIASALISVGGRLSEEKGKKKGRNCNFAGRNLASDLWLLLCS